jgi:hypothetical protein
MLIASCTARSRAICRCSFLLAQQMPFAAVARIVRES